MAEEELLKLLESLVDPDKCWFDHNGDCQAHGFTLEPGEVCPNEQAQRILAARAPESPKEATQ